MLAFYLSLVNDDESQNKIELIYTKYRPYMTYCAFRVLRNKSDAEDATHEAMLRIIKHIEKIDTTDLDILKHFCGRVAENVAKDLNRLQKNEAENISYSDLVVEPYSDTDTTEEYYFSHNAAEVVYQNIKLMSPTYKDICMMKFIYGLNDMEISDLLSINYKTVSSYISRGRLVLKKALKEAGYHE